MFGKERLIFVINSQHSYGGFQVPHKVAWMSLESRTFAVESYFTVRCKLCVDVLALKTIIRILLYSQQFDKLTIIEKKCSR